MEEGVVEEEGALYQTKVSQSLAVHFPLKDWAKNNSEESSHQYQYVFSLL